jgi:hypothetical protein
LVSHALAAAALLTVVRTEVKVKVHASVFETETLEIAEVDDIYFSNFYRSELGAPAAV